MFAADATREQRNAALAVMSAPVLPMVVQELARVGDVKSLRALKELGRFDFDWTDLTGSAPCRHPVLVRDALPMVDALAAIVENQSRVQASWTGSMEMRSEVTTSVPRLNASTALKAFVRDVYVEVIEGLNQGLVGTCDARKRGDIWDEPVKLAFACVERTLDVIGAVACAMDDPDLYLRSREGSNQRRGPVLGSHIFSGAMGEVTPTAVALYFQSANALSAIGLEAFDQPVVGHEVGDPQSMQRWYAEVLDMQDSVPSPALMSAMLGSMRRPDGTFREHDSNWIKATLVHMACRGDWGHLLPMLIADHPDVIELGETVAKRFAMDHALPEVMAFILPNLVIQPPVRRPDQWFDGQHPVPRLLDCASNNAIDHGDIDATLTLVLRAMVERGQIGDVLDPAQTGTVGHWAAHTCAHFGFTSSIALLIDAGLDPSEKDPLGLSVLDVAERGGRPVVANMLRAAGARRAAMAAIGEMTLHEGARAPEFSSMA